MGYPFDNEGQLLTCVTSFDEACCVWPADPATARKTRPFKVALSHVGTGLSVTVRHLAWGPGRPQPMQSCTKRYKYALLLPMQYMY